MQFPKTTGTEIMPLPNIECKIISRTDTSEVHVHTGI